MEQLPLILYVDDERENLTGFKFTFRKHYRTLCAESGAEGLRLLQEQQDAGDEVLLVITDQRMPQMTGVDFLEQVAKRFPDTVRMVATGYSDVEAVMQAINKGGAFRYITKPWITEDLLHTIEQAISHYRLRVENQRLFKELQISERKMATLLSHLPGMVYRSDSQGWKTCYASSGCLELTGVPAEAFLNGAMRYADLIDPDHRAHVLAQWKEALQSQKAFEVVYPIHTRSGHIKWVMEKGIAVEEDAAFFLEGFVSDITSQKQTEERLKVALEEVQVLKQKVEEENLYLRQEVKAQHGFDEIVSGSSVFEKTIKQIGQVAPSDTTVLILGETGTGKELLARAVHHASARSKGPLVKVNCAALPANLIESELFGHEKGSFTGAIARKIGRFELADKGTIFLDEIGELPLDLQSKLLRVLQEGELERVGGSQTIKVDVRIVAATNRDLGKEVEKGAFRADLYYRLNVFPIKTPPLRDRREDIPPLVKHFVAKYAAKMGRNIDTIPKDVMAQLEMYQWPGNVRELENIIERAVIISTGKKLELGDWFNINEAPITTGRMLTLDDNEREHILKALKMTNWRVSGDKGAAKLLDINDRTLQSRMKKLGIRRGAED